VKRWSVSAWYRVVWAVLAAAILAGVVVWAMRIGTSLGSDQDAAPSSPVPVATAAPHIATVYSDMDAPTAIDLCAELSPTPKQVTVESTSGVVIETLQCSG
jgi:hypothetical protein